MNTAQWWHRWTNDQPLPYFRGHATHDQLVYVQADMPKFQEWLQRNEDFFQRNAIDEEHFPVENFPLIEDFEVVLDEEALLNLKQKGKRQYTDGEITELSLHYSSNFSFFSPSRGILAHPPSCPLEALCQEHFVIPWGDFATPYYDFDQGWEFLLAEKDGFMYILEGSYDAEPQGGYDRWFKVDVTRYKSEWERVIQICRDICTGCQEK